MRHAREQRGGQGPLLGQPLTADSVELRDSTRRVCAETLCEAGLDVFCVRLASTVTLLPSLQGVSAAREPRHPQAKIEIKDLRASLRVHASTDSLGVPGVGAGTRADAALLALVKGRGDGRELGQSAQRQGEHCNERGSAHSSRLCVKKKERRADGGD